MSECKQTRGKEVMACYKNQFLLWIQPSAGHRVLSKKTEIHFVLNKILNSRKRIVSFSKDRKTFSQVIFFFFARGRTSIVKILSARSNFV